MSEYKTSPKDMLTLDFETEGIVGNPIVSPPVPVGLAVRWPSGDKEYITDLRVAKEIFLQAIGNRQPMLFHNAPFDLSVAEKWLGVPWPDWGLVHDTIYLLYLKDPYAKSYALKHNAERYLGIPPDEQDACKAWIMDNVPEARDSDWGKHLSKVPEPILEPYAKQDVEDTYLLFDLLYPETQVPAYDRERELMPTLINATKRGVRVAVAPLEQALEVYTAALERADALLGTTLRVPNLNPNSPAQLADALDNIGAVDKWTYTPTGNKSCDMKKLRIKDPVLMNLLRYRSVLKTILGTFIKGWLSLENGGRLHPSWNPTKSDTEGGTRTGRLSSSRPNFQNIPNPKELMPIDGLPELPAMRNFILPESGHVWIKRDFSAQEIRVMAHFEGGALAQAFRDDPNLDPHEMVRKEILAISGKDYPRKYVKETGFGILYGMGAATLGGRLGIDSSKSRNLMAAYKRAIPGVEKLQKGTKRRGYAQEPIRTWGGRLIYTEPPRPIQGVMRSFEYKLLNYLIQGSSADQTKQCIIEWDKERGAEDMFMATVHDEINISAPIEDAKLAMSTLRRCMEDICEFSVPMRSDGFSGPSWGEVGDE